MENDDKSKSKRTSKLSKSVSTVCSDGERVTTVSISCAAVDTNMAEDVKNIGASTSLEAESVEENNKPIGQKRKAEKALASECDVKVGKLQTVDDVKNCGAFTESTDIDKKNESVVDKIEEIKETEDAGRNAGLGLVNDEKITGGRKKNVDCKSKNIESDSEVTEQLVSKSSIPNKVDVNGKKLKKNKRR